MISRMKRPLFDSVERVYINNHYHGNKIIHPKNALIENYELAKVINNFKKVVKQSVGFKLIIKLLDFTARVILRIMR